MNWNALKNFKCPKDNKLLETNYRYYFCRKCTFRLTPYKFNIIVYHKYKKKREVTAEEKELERNNFGLKL